MAAIKCVNLAEDPRWHTNRTLSAEPGVIEMSLEGNLVFVRIIGESPTAARLKHRLGARFCLARWESVVFEDDKPMRK